MFCVPPSKLLKKCDGQFWTRSTKTDKQAISSPFYSFRAVRYSSFHKSQQFAHTKQTTIQHHLIHALAAERDLQRVTPIFRILNLNIGVTPEDGRQRPEGVGEGVVS